MARSNPWTAQQIANDMHLGSRVEAALIAAENGNDEPLTCGKCGGAAHYKHTIGTEKCISCGSLRLGTRWS